MNKEPRAYASSAATQVWPVARLRMGAWGYSLRCPGNAMPGTSL